MTNNIIIFDSNDWDSIRDTINKINKIGCPQIGETTDGESILFDVSNNGDNDVLVTAVSQKNGWLRINHYDPSDYTIEETYKKA